MTTNNTQTNGTATPPSSQTPESTPEERNISNSVMNKIKVFEETGSLHVPKNYSAPNALRVAWLMLQDIKNSDNKPALSICTKESVANALLKMVIQGLNPAKRQCSFVVYGNILTMQREYQGAIAIAKRDAGLKSITANAVFKGDEFEFVIDPDNLAKKIVKHVQTMASMDSGDVIGAYAIKEYNDGRKEAEVMPMSQIKKAWEMGKAKGQSPAHKNFPDQMAMKTVIARALKTDINSSDDSVLLEDVDGDYIPQDDAKTADVKHRIAENSNQEEIKMDEEGTEEGEVDRETGEVLESAQTENKRGF